MHSGKRSAGILLPVPSLPSAFGVGDFGAEAYNFAEFLHRSSQRYWQLLPLNPVESQQNYSPYSAVSAMAGNTLLISMEKLAGDGLLKPEQLLRHPVTHTDSIHYAQAWKTKDFLLKEAFHNFHSQPREKFENFCRYEAYWLDDFALYLVLKEHFGQKAWYDWPPEFRMRKASTLASFTNTHKEALESVKWFQFIFFRQWKELKDHCRELNIRMVGDLPFYISYDSADVWSHPEIFKLSPSGAMEGMAGVPPDYFNKNGQCWGMPVFRWDVLHDQHYDWWLKRIRKNLELFDVLRLDHFRAFSEYWEVPAREKTAIHGEWKPGPGQPFFRFLKKELGDLPFIAEDLGDINEDVHKLRDDFRLPGMKVLQFAFGEQMPQSDHIPHNFTPNFVAYTGTHDNNTTRGWFRSELKAKDRRQIKAYCGMTVTEKNVHLVLSRMAYASVARTVILPLQDILGLGEHARINKPASSMPNWLWRLRPGDIPPATEKWLREWTQRYGRDTDLP